MPCEHTDAEALRLSFTPIWLLEAFGFTVVTEDTREVVICGTCGKPLGPWTRMGIDAVEASDES